MQAVIMAGGFGTRLRPLTNNIPKPMVPILNKPILEHIINLLKLHGIRDYVVLLLSRQDQGLSWRRQKIRRQDQICCSN
ncbi:MAG: NTP transferase domain-containing protein [Ignavibacteria bacterium]|nr:NTP transferase domain-containing protein [Ignavibacteria bacterium]